MTDDKAAVRSVEHDVCDEIKQIMQTYREQEAEQGYVDTPGGLEHMGDVWKLFSEWDDRLRGANAIQAIAALSPRTEGRVMVPRESVAALQETVQKIAAMPHYSVENLDHPEHRKSLLARYQYAVGLAEDALRLTAAPAAGAEQGWRDISTAPRDGNAVLLFQPWKSGRETLCIGHYANGWINQLCLYCAHDQERAFGGDIGNEVMHCEPTHWQPLPPPPSA